MNISQFQHILNWALIKLSNTKKENEGQGHRPSVFDLEIRCTVYSGGARRSTSDYNLIDGGVYLWTSFKKLFHGFHEQLSSA